MSVATRTLSSNDVADAIPPELHHRFTVDEYHRMIETGIVRGDDRVQLISGVVLEMSPQNERHARLIQRLNRVLVRALGDEYAVRPQLPLTLGADSEPEPDLAVVRAEDAASPDEHPRSAVLVIEVSGDSIRFDRGLKAALYARAGIPEYWIFDAEAHSVEVYRNPDPAASRYTSATRLESESTLEATSIPGLSVELAPLWA
jgi:Uma2 family endonuclease